MTGRLVVVGTPIGNLGDLSVRFAAAGADLEGRVLVRRGVPRGILVEGQITESESGTPVHSAMKFQPSSQISCVIWLRTG